MITQIRLLKGILGRARSEDGLEITLDTELGSQAGAGNKYEKAYHPVLKDVTGSQIASRYQFKVQYQSSK